MSKKIEVISAIDRERISEIVDSAKELGNYYFGIPPEELTIDKYIKAYSRECEKSITYYQLSLYLGYLLIGYKKGTPEYKFCKAFIDHPEYAEKVKIVNDGSFRMNRFWLRGSTWGGELYLLTMIYKSYKNQEDVEFKRDSIYDKIKYVYNHHDAIYLQIDGMWNKLTTIYEEDN